MPRAHLSLQACVSVRFLLILSIPASPGSSTWKVSTHHGRQDRTSNPGRLRPALLGSAPAAFMKLVATGSDADLYRLLVVDGDSRAGQLLPKHKRRASSIHFRFDYPKLSEEFVSFRFSSFVVPVETNFYRQAANRAGLKSLFWSLLLSTGRFLFDADNSMGKLARGTCDVCDMSSSCSFQQIYPPIAGAPEGKPST
jgi:hypothetical protein